MFHFPGLFDPDMTILVVSGCIEKCIFTSVVDPDLYVFGPSGSGYGIIGMDLDPSINKQKTLEKP